MRRKILYATGGLLVLLAAAFFLRKQWLAPILRTQLTETLAKTFDGEVVVGEIGGNLLDEIRISGIQVTGRPGRLLSRLQGGAVRVEFRLLGLLSGEADAIRRLTLDCQELVVDTAGNMPPAEGAAATGPTAADLHGLLPEGGRIHVESLVLRHGSRERRAPFEVTLGPLGPTREVHARHGTSHVQLRLAESGTAEGDIQVADTGGLLRALGFDNDLRSGQLRARFALSRERLRVPDMDVSLPGLQLTCTDLTLPLASDALHQARGEVVVAIADLDRQVARMQAVPKEVRELLPNRGRVRAQVRDGKLVVADGKLVGRGLSLELRQGELSLTGELAQMSGTVGFTLNAVSPVVLPLPGGQRLQVQGRVDGQVRGSLAAPALHATARLDEVRHEQVVLRNVDATVDFEGGETTAVLTRAELHSRAQDLGPVSLAGKGRLAGGEVSAELRGGLDPRWLSLAGLVPPGGGPIGFELTGRSTVGGADPSGEARLVVPDLRLDGEGKAWRLSLDVARDQARLLLSGNGSLRLEGRRAADGTLEGEVRLKDLEIAQLATLAGFENLRGTVSGTGRLEGSTGCQVTELRVSTGGLQAEVQGYLPICWSEGGLTVVAKSARPDRPWLHGKAWGVTADPLVTGGQIQHQVAVALGPKGLEIQKLQAESAAGAVVVRGNVQVAAERLLDPPRNPPLDLTVDLRSFRLEGLPARWKRGFSVAGLVSGRLQVAGPATRPRVKGTLEGKDLMLRHPQAPALESGEVHLELRPNEIVVKRFTAQVGGTRMELAGKVGVDAEDIWQALDRPDVALAGDLRLEDVPLSFLSPARVGLEEVGGLVSGRLRFGGTVGDPKARIELSLRKGLARAAGRPPLHDLAIHVVVTERAVTVDRCGGMVGSTAFSVGGALESPSVSLWKLWSEPDAAVKGVLQVQDLTLDALPPKWTGLDDLRGRVSGSFKLTGSRAKPQLEGHLQVTGGSVKPPRMPRLEDLEARVEVSGSVVKLRARGTLGAGPLEVEASLDSGKQGLLTAATAIKVTATVRGRDLLLVRGPGMRLRADVNLGVAGNLGEMVVDGGIDITSAKFQRRMSLLPDPRLEGGSALTRMGPPSIGDERLRFRVDVATKKPAIVRTHVLDADLDAALKLVGPGNALQLQGVVSARSGVLRFPGSSMRLDTGQVIFDPRYPNRPELVVNASGRRYGFETSLVARGRPGDIEVEMSSVPPLSAKEVMVLIITGVPPDRLASRETRANVGLVGSYVVTELLGSFFASESLEGGESFAERFTFVFGTEVSRYGKETWAVEYDLSHLGLENFAARVEQDIYEDQSVNLIYKLQF